MELILCPKDGDRNILELHLDGELWRAFHVYVVGNHPKFPDFRTPSELEEYFLAFETRYAKNYCLKRLSSMSCSSVQLRQKLEERLISAQVIEAVLGELEQLGYLNDREWVENYIRRQPKCGPRLLAAKLRAKGFPREMIEESLEGNSDSEEEKERLLSLIKTGYRSKNLKDFKDRQKVIASLIRKGFNISVIKEVMNLLVNSC